MPPVPFPSRLLFSRNPTRRRLPSLALVALLAAALLSTLVSPVSRADTIPVKSAELRVEDGEVLLNAEFQLAFNSTLEEALQRGIALYFVLEFELTRSRWYWLDERVGQASLTSRVSYNALTRQYRVSSGLLTQTLGSLEEVERYIGRVTSRPVAQATALSRGQRYDAAIRLRLDVNQLPKPFQVDALASREWTLDSGWYRWSFVP
ncbi:MAG: DUF4390 domain-containing protein [Burkholderiales bacterium]|nr:DUF4390 domain-containing protein [Burkholderiales bacterium]